ncbi:MAG: MbnP family protein [Cyclobacteriaceae bacterium]
MMKKIMLLLAASALIFVACDKEEVKQTFEESDTGTLRVYIEHVADTVAPSHGSSGSGHLGRLSSGGHDTKGPFDIAVNKYVSAQGDTFGLTKLEYLLTDFFFTYEGEEYEAKNAALYIRQDQVERSNEINKTIELPVGAYSDLEFLLGLNDTENFTDSTSGELADAYNNGMIWAWNTGYKFARIEGSVKENGVATVFPVQHIGTTANKRDVSINETFQINKDKVTELHIQINVSELFKDVSLSTANGGHSGGGHAGRILTATNDKGTIMDNLASALGTAHYIAPTNESN